MNPKSKSTSERRAATVAVVMGVAGVGKTAVGRLAADRLGWEFVDGDDYHPEANVDKMSRGTALTDNDRGEWLRLLEALISERLSSGRSTVIACSALKESYRRKLTADNDGAVVVYLKASKQIVRDRIQRRTGHFFDAALLESQFEALEEPRTALTIDATQPIDKVVDDVVSTLAANGHTRRPPTLEDDHRS